MATQSVRIPIELELRNTQSAINSLKSALAGVSKESGFYKTISKEIDAVDKKFKELSATASRPFKSVGSISSFENQFMRLGDRITEIGRSFGDLNFKDLNLKGIQDAEANFNKLSKQVTDAQNKLNGINTKQMKSALADSTSGLEEVFNKLRGFDKGGNLLNVDSFEKTFASLSNKATQLSEQMTEAQSKLERLKASSSQTQTKLGFFDEAQKKIQQFVSGTDLSQEAFAKMLQPLASQAGMEPERFLDLLGLNKPGLYTGAADKIQKNLTAAIASSKNKLTNQSFKNQNEIAGVESTIQGLQNYINVVTEAKRRLEELQNSSATKGQVQVAKGEYDQAVNELNNFIETCKRANPAMKGVEDSAGAIGSAMNGVPGKCAAATSEMNRFTDAANKMAQFKSRLAYFFSFYKVMGTVRNVVKNAAKSIKELDSVMTEISVVTSMTQKDLWEQMDTYKAIANEYAVSIKGVYEVSQLYYQQGLQTAQVMELTVETLKMAKIANLDYATATDYMTVAVRGFKMEMSDAQRVTDVYSALAANTASNTEEIAIAMSKTASSADAVGSSFESTSAMIATMVAITREAPENIGSALKSIISRYGEMTSDPTKLVDSEGEEMSLNRVDTALKSVGITLQNAQGEFRDFDEVILELAQKWDTIDANAQRYIATIMAGNRQQSRFLALVGNYEQYVKALDIANNSEDASAQQVLKTMDSVESKITNVKTAWQSFYTSMGLENLFKGALEVITQIINNINKMSKFDAIVTFFNLFKALKGMVMGTFAGIANQFSQIKNLAQDAVKPLQDTQKIQVDTTQPQTEFQKLRDLLIEALTQELKIDTSAANQLLEQLGIKVKDVMVPKGTNVTSGATYNSQYQQVENVLNTRDRGWWDSLIGTGKSGKTLQGFMDGTKVNNKALDAAFGKETALRDAFVQDFRSFVNENGSNYKNMQDLSAGYMSHLQKMGDAELKAYLDKLLSNAKNKDADDQVITAKKNFAQRMLDNAAGWRVAAQALTAAGAALTTFALTLKDASDAAVEGSKVASGGGALLSGVGGAISGALLGANAGPYGAIIGGIAGGAAGIISGLKQIFDGLNYTTLEKIANSERELKELQDEETKKKAKSSSYNSALSELEKLKEAQYDSAEAAEAYKDKMNTLAESYPELVDSMDSAGNAIIEIESLEKKLADARIATAQATVKTLEQEVHQAQLKKQAALDALNALNEFSPADANIEETPMDSVYYIDKSREVSSEEEGSDLLLNTVQDLLKIGFSNIDAPAIFNQNPYALSFANGDPVENLSLGDILSYSTLDGEDILYKGQKITQIVNDDEPNRPFASLPNINYTGTQEEVAKRVLEYHANQYAFLDHLNSILVNNGLKWEDLGLEYDYSGLVENINDEQLTLEEQDKLIKLWSIDLPNALNQNLKNKNKAIEEAIPILAQSHAELALNKLGVGTEDYGLYREVSENYSGIFKTIGGKILEDAFSEAKKIKPDINAKDWFSTQNIEQIFSDERFNDEEGKKGFLDLEIFDYEEISKIWDNMKAYDPTEIEAALNNLGLDSDIISLIIDSYRESFDYSKNLAYKQIENSKTANKSSTLKALTNASEIIQAPADLMDDINKTVQAADNFYKQGLTKRGDNLIAVAETFYLAATKLDVSDYLDIRSIIDNLDLTNLEDLTEARAAIEALNTENQYGDLLTSIDAAINNCSQNIDALAQKIVSETITTIEKISEVIDGFESGFEAKEALEAYKKLNGYKGLLEGKSFDYFFEYDEALGKWVYTNQGMSDILEAQAKEIEVSNAAIDDLIAKSESEVHDVLGLRTKEGYVKNAKDYYKEETGTYRGAWTRLSAEDQAYREWARSVQDQEGLEADVSKKAYIEHLKQQAADGEKAAQLMWEQMIYSLGDTLELEQIVTGALGDGADREKAVDTAAEMVKARYAKKGLDLGEKNAQIIGKWAIQALEAGRYAVYEKLTGDQLSPKEVADSVSKKATALNDAVLKAIEAPGTIIDETTYNILAEAGLASHIKWDEQGFGIVTDAATDYVAMIEAIASQGGVILEEQNSTLASLYEKSFGADKAKTLSGLSSKSNLTFSDLADLATAQEKTLNSFFDKNTGEINLSGLTYNDFLGEFEVTDFDAYWTEVTGSLDRKTAEYLEAYSKWVNDQIDDSNKTAKEAQTQLDNLLDANIGDKVNVSYLESIAPNINDYLGTIVDGVATITDSSNLLGLLQYVTQLDAESNILENSVGELRDSIVELIEGWADAISSGLKGELDFTDAESLMTQFGLTDADFSETKNGLKLSKDAAYDLYKQLKQIAPIQAELVFDSIAESLTEAGSGYEDVASTMETIAKLNEELANVPVDSSRREELERELEVAKEILRVRSQDPDSFNFMDKDLPTGMQGPENYWNSVGEAYKTMNESAKSGYMEIQDYVNIINHMSQMVEAAGGEFQIANMNAAQLIEAGMSSLSNIDGEGVKVNLESLGVDILGGTEGMKAGFDGAIKEMARSQIEMLDSAIQLLETIVAMEELGEIDANKDNTIDFGEIFTFSGDPDDPTGFTGKYSHYIEKVKTSLTEAGVALSEVSIAGHSLDELLTSDFDTWKQLNIDAKQHQDLINGLYQAVLSDDYDPNKISSIFETWAKNVGQEFSFSSDQLSVKVTPTGEVLSIDWTATNIEEQVKNAGFESIKEAQEIINKYFKGESLGEAELTSALKLLGKITEKDGKFTYTDSYGKTHELPSGTENLNEEIAKAEEKGLKDHIAGSDYTGKGTVQTLEIEEGVSIDFLLEENGNGKFTGIYNGKTYEGASAEDVKNAIAEAVKQEAALSAAGISFSSTPITVKGVTYTKVTLATGDTVWQDENGQTLTNEAMTQKLTEEVSAQGGGEIINATTEATLEVSSVTNVSLGEGIQPETGFQLTTPVKISSTADLEINAIQNPILEEGVAGVTENPISLTGGVGVVEGEASSLAITKIPAEGALKTGEEGSEVGTISITNGIPNVEGEVTAITLTPVANATSSVSGDVPAANVPTVTINGTAYTVDVTKAKQTAENAVMGLTGVKAGKADVEATSYTVTFTDANGTTQTVVVQGEAQLAATLLGATNVGGIWQLANVTGQADISVSETSKSGLLSFIDEILEKFKNIEIGFEEAPTEPPVANKQEPGVYNAAVVNTTTGTAQNFNNADMGSLISTIQSQIANGFANEGQYTIEKVAADGSVIESTTVTIAADNFDVVSTNTNISGGAENTNSSESNSNSSSSATEAPTLDTSSMVAGMQTAAVEMASSMESGASTGATNAASKIQASLDAIEPPVIEIEKPDTVKIGIEATAKVRVEVTGDATASASITGTKVKSKGNVALAKGGLAAASGRGTLMGELGPELVVSNGRYFTVGNNGAEFVDLPNDAIVFNHLQTKKLLGSGKGMVGTGEPVTNERNAVAFATGNVSGPAMASAKDALAQLRQIRAMWQSMLDASAKDLGSKAGGGSGGGGGGGDEEDLAAYIHDLERWYNLLRQIEKWEQKITYEQARRQNLQSGYDYSKSLQNELRMLKKQKAAYQELADLQRDYYDKRREDLLSTDYSKIFTYDEDGLMQYVDGPNRGLDILATLNETNANGKAKMDSKAQIAYLKKLGFDTEQFRIKGDGTKLKAKDYGGMMEVFWEGIDTWMEELDGLYDSVNEHLTNVEENQAAQQEILDEYNENQLSLEQELLTAMIDAEQSNIDRMQLNLDAIEEASSNYIKGLTDALNKEQEMYKQDQTDTETQKLQKQLAILQRSGGSASEIKALQEQLDARMQDEYFNQQQQQIDKIQEASDAQIEKLQQQIDIATEALEYQKENGLFWNTISTMISTWPVEDLLAYVQANNAEYQSLSNLDLETKMKTLQTSIEMQKDYLYNVKYDDETLDAQAQASWDVYSQNANLESAWQQMGFTSADEFKEWYIKAYKEATGTNEEREEQVQQDITDEETAAAAREEKRYNVLKSLGLASEDSEGNKTEKETATEKALENLKTEQDKLDNLNNLNAFVNTLTTDMQGMEGWDKATINNFKKWAQNGASGKDTEKMATYFSTYLENLKAMDPTGENEEIQSKIAQTKALAAQLGFTVGEDGKVTAVKNSKGKYTNSGLTKAITNQKTSVSDANTAAKKAQSTDLDYARKQALLNNIEQFDDLEVGSEEYDAKINELTAGIFALGGKATTYDSKLKAAKLVRDSKNKTANSIPAGTVLNVIGFKGSHNSDWLKASFLDPMGNARTTFFKWSEITPAGLDKEVLLENIRKAHGGALPQYLHGGLVDFTGPAWVDGTKSKPEAFLSAKDTALLKSKIFSDSDYSLRSVIEAIQGMSNSFGTINNSSVSGGITIENVTVEVQPGVISSDYDARRAGEMALEEIVKVARRSTNLNAMRR